MHTVDLSDYLYDHLFLISGNGNLEQTATARAKVLQILGKYSESKTVSTSVLEVYVWSLGQFCGAEVEHGQQALEKLVSLGHKVLCNQKPSTVISQGVRNLLIAIIQSAGHVAEKCGTTVSSLEEFIRQTMKSHLADVYLRHTCMEFLLALPHITLIHEALQQPTETETQLDFTLSFLDRYVCESLAGDGMPYQPKLLHKATPLCQIVPLSTDHATVPSTPTELSNSCPSPISSGTGSVVDFPGSESFSSEDSKLWSLKR
jgi:hypothetical protein